MKEEIGVDEIASLDFIILILDILSLYALT